MSRQAKIAIVVAVVACLLAVLLHGLRPRPIEGVTGRSAANSLAHGREESAQLVPASIDPANIFPVEVGLYVENYHDVSVKDRRFMAEGYFWYKWEDRLDSVIKRLSLDPTRLIEISNMVDEWDSAMTPMYDKPVRLKDGRQYMQIRFSANFYIPHLDLTRSPFESLVLPLNLEVYPNELAIQASYVQLIPEKLNQTESFYGRDAEIDGYHLDGITPQPFGHNYDTSWGLEEGELTFSSVRYAALFSSDPGPGILLWVLPVLIVTMIVIIAPSIESSLGDIRIAIPSTGLLTLIFLQQGYRDTLPALDYLTFLDWLYACAYVISLVIFVVFLWSTNVCHRAGASQAEYVAKRVERVDLIAQVSSISALMIVGLLAWF